MLTRHPGAPCPRTKSRTPTSRRVTHPPARGLECGARSLIATKCSTLLHFAPIGGERFSRLVEPRPAGVGCDAFCAIERSLRARHGTAIDVVTRWFHRVCFRIAPHPSGEA